MKNKKENKLLPRRLSVYREKIFKELWKSYKGDLTMSELALILRYNVSQFYKIVSKGTKHGKSKKL